MVFRPIVAVDDIVLDATSAYKVRSPQTMATIARNFYTSLPVLS